MTPPLRRILGFLRPAAEPKDIAHKQISPKRPAVEPKRLVIALEDQNFEVLLRRSARSRRFVLKLSGATGEAVLTLPEKATLKQARAFLEQCIRRFEEGHLPPEEAAMCKYWLTDVEARVVDGCVQMFGGSGFMREYPVARAYADIRGQRIYAGTNEIMKEIIARTL